MIALGIPCETRWCSDFSRGVYWWLGDAVMNCLWLLSLYTDGPVGNCLLLYALIGAGGVSSRGGFLVTCGQVWFGGFIGVACFYCFWLVCINYNYTVLCCGSCGWSWKSCNWGYFGIIWFHAARVFCELLLLLTLAYEVVYQTVHDLGYWLMDLESHGPLMFTQMVLECVYCGLVMCNVHLWNWFQGMDRWCLIHTPWVGLIHTSWVGIQHLIQV